MNSKSKSISPVDAVESLNNIIENWCYRPTEVKAAKMAIEAIQTLNGDGYAYTDGMWKQPDENKGWRT